MFKKINKKTEEESKEEPEENPEDADDDSEEEPEEPQNKKTFENDIWEIKEVPTQIAQVIINKKTGEKLNDVPNILVKILNNQRIILKLLRE